MRTQKTSAHRPGLSFSQDLVFINFDCGFVHQTTRAALKPPMLFAETTAEEFQILLQDPSISMGRYCCTMWTVLQVLQLLEGRKKQKHKKIKVLWRHFPETYCTAIQQLSLHHKSVFYYYNSVDLASETNSITLKKQDGQHNGMCW